MRPATGRQQCYQADMYGNIHVQYTDQHSLDLLAIRAKRIGRLSINLGRRKDCIGTPEQRLLERPRQLA